MNNFLKYRAKFDELHLCIIIPTYNNAATLGRIITDVLEYTGNILVVNDGSTDNTENVLKSFPSLTVLTISKNTGKGNALRKGFSKAVEMGYKYSITIDSDGQHFAKDIPLFIGKLESCPNAIIIGARNMDQSGIPGKSSFGHNFSNFWFKVETGISAPDTQSGFRLYPVESFKDIHFFTKKFEFEIEILVRTAWKGIMIESVPVSVYYAPANERVSHFRPVKDFARISVLNTILVIISILYIRPRNFFRKLFLKKKFRKIINEHLFNKHESELLKSISIAFGIFMGIVPIWGFQLIVAIFFAILFRLNKPLVIIAANISIPPMIPLILYLSYKIGAYSMGANATNLQFSKQITLETVRHHWEQYFYGSIMLAVSGALVFGILSYIILKIFERRISLSS